MAPPGRRYPSPHRRPLAVSSLVEYTDYCYTTEEQVQWELLLLYRLQLWLCTSTGAAGQHQLYTSHSQGQDAPSQTEAGDRGDTILKSLGKKRDVGQAVLACKVVVPPSPQTEIGMAETIDSQQDSLGKDHKLKI